MNEDPEMAIAVIKSQLQALSVRFESRAELFNEEETAHKAVMQCQSEIEELIDKIGKRAEE